MLENSKIVNFRFWAHKVLPLVYDDSLSYYEFLCKVVQKLNEVIDSTNVTEQNMEELIELQRQLQEYVDNYFANLNVQTEIDHKLDEMVEDGTFDRLITPIVSEDVAENLGDIVATQIDDVVADQIDDAVAGQIGRAVAEQIGDEVGDATTNWLNDNVTPVGSAVTVDKTLTISDSAGDAKVTGQFRDGFNSLFGVYNALPAWTTGEYLSITTGKKVSNNKYCRTGMLNGNGYRIAYEILNSDYEFSVVFYDSTGNITSGTGFLGAYGYNQYIKYIPKNAYYVGMSVRRLDNANITSSDVTAINNALKIWTGTSRYMDELGVPADSLVVGDTLMNNELPVHPCMFEGNTWVDASGTKSVDNASVSTGITIRFKDLGYVRFECDDDSIYFSIRRTGTTSFVTSKATKFIYNGDANVWVNIKRNDGQQFTLTDLAKFHMYSSKQVYDKYIEDNFYNIARTQRFPNYVDSDYIGRYGVYQTANQMGFLERGQATKRATTKPIICPSDCVLLCGKYYNNNRLVVIVNGEKYDVPLGGKITIPANTLFSIGFYNDTTDNENTMTQATVCIVKGTDYGDGTRINQYLNDSTVSNYMNSACRVNNKIFLVGASPSNEYYSVYDTESGEFTTSDAPLPHSAGHANSCCYADGYIYVSDWTDGTKIHVFTLNEETDALTYVKDIQVPDEGFGSVEYVVRNNEEEVLFLGWEEGNSSQNPNNLVYGLFVLTTEGYKLSWVKRARRPSVMQGFTFVNNKMYYISVDGDSHTNGIWELDLNTGLTNRYTVDGTLSNNEAEGIMTVYDGEDSNFYITDVHGKLYFYSIRH